VAYGIRSQLALLSFDGHQAEQWAQRAATLAEQLGDVQAKLDAAVHRSVARLLSGVDENGCELREARRAAHAEGLEELTIRAATYLAFLPALNRRYDDAERLLDEAEQFVLDHELGYWQQLVVAVRLMCHLATGRWSGIEAAALGLLERRDLAAVPRLTALFTLGRLKARRGESDGRTYLDRAVEVTRQHRRVAAVTPVWPAIAEGAWLSGNRDAALETVRRAEADETSAWSPWALGDLALWRYLASGHSRSEKERPVAEPYALILAGHGEAAAELWQQRGCPYEAAVA